MVVYRLVTGADKSQVHRCLMQADFQRDTGRGDYIHPQKIFLSVKDMSPSDVREYKEAFTLKGRRSSRELVKTPGAVVIYNSQKNFERFTVPADVSSARTLLGKLNLTLSGFGSHLFLEEEK